MDPEKPTPTKAPALTKKPVVVAKKEPPPPPHPLETEPTKRHQLVDLLHAHSKTVIQDVLEGKVRAGDFASHADDYLTPKVGALADAIMEVLRDR